MIIIKIIKVEELARGEKKRERGSKKRTYNLPSLTLVTFLMPEFEFKGNFTWRTS